MSFSNFYVPINEFTILVFLVVCLYSYYLIFKEHHKRNELKFHEIYPLAIHYLILCIISFFVFLFGIDRVLEGYIYNEDIYDLIKELITGFAIISVDIINFIFYIKKNKVDLAEEEREEQEVRDSKIAEIVEIVILSAMFILPIFHIFRYINFIDTGEKIRQIGGGILFMIVSGFLLFSLNPLDIRGKLKKIFKKVS